MQVKHKSGRIFTVEIDFISKEGKRLMLVSLPIGKSSKRTDHKNYYVLWGNSVGDSSEFGITEMATYPRWEKEDWSDERYWRSTSGSIKEFHKMTRSAEQVTFTKR